MVHVAFDMQHFVYGRRFHKIPIPIIISFDHSQVLQWVRLFNAFTQQIKFAFGEFWEGRKVFLILVQWFLSLCVNSSPVSGNKFGNDQTGLSQMLQVFESVNATYTKGLIVIFCTQKG